MKKTKAKLFTGIMIIVLMITSCSLFKDYYELSPPDWIIGSWMDTNIHWRFTSNNAIYTDEFNTNFNFKEAIEELGFDNITDATNGDTYTITEEWSDGVWYFSFTKVSDTELSYTYKYYGNPTTLPLDKQ